MLPTAESGAVGGGCISWQSPHPEHATWRRHFSSRFSCFSRFQPRSADGIAGASAWSATAGERLACLYVDMLVLWSLIGCVFVGWEKGKRRGLEGGREDILIERTG